MAYCKHMIRLTARLLAGISAPLLLVAPLAVVLSAGTGWTGEREQFGKILQSMPPNGPFWKYGNVVMRRKSKKAGMDPVIFTHWNHRPLYTCRVCHVELEFSMRAGDTGISRGAYLAGKYCGACHDGNIAFTVKDGNTAACNRCHIKDSKSLEERFDEFAAQLPIAGFGNGIDWAEAVARGIIEPSFSILSDQPPMKLPEKLKKPIRLGTTSPRSDVTFSHEEHFAELDCSNCHPDIFNIKRKGTEAFTMDSNLFGNFCGACHFKVAFPMQECRRCHPQMSNTYSF